MAAELMISFVKVRGGQEMMELTSPYKPEMPPHCRRLGGRWNASVKKWYFNPNKREELIQACFEVYGQTPSLTVGERNDVAVNTAFQAALDYVQGIKAQADDLSEQEKNEVLMSLLEVLS